MLARDGERAICPECAEAHVESPAQGAAGGRCPHHPHRVLVDRESFERFPRDRVLGTVIASKYAVTGVLGMGGFGAVYRAIQEPVGRPVALKVVHARNAEESEHRARFFREARLVARLRDPAVVTLYDYGEVPELGLYMVFELIEGRSLTSLCREGPQEPVRVTHILLLLLRALGEAHARGVVHRDLKPGNVMLVETASGDEEVRLLDFGIAKVLRAEDAEKSLETQQGLVMGTPLYLSPEQARATGTVDLRSDLYSLAVMGYTLLAGSNPFNRPSVIETLMAHVSEPPPPLDPELGVPPELEAVLRRALEKDPGDRFQTADEMGEALRAVFPDVAFPSSRWRVTTNPVIADPDYASTPSGFRAPSRASEAVMPDPSSHHPLTPERGTFTETGRSEKAPARSRRRLWAVLAASAVLLLLAGAWVTSILTAELEAAVVEGNRSPRGGVIEAPPLEPAALGGARPPARTPIREGVPAKAPAPPEGGDENGALGSVEPEEARLHGSAEPARALDRADVEASSTRELKSAGERPAARDHASEAAAARPTGERDSDPAARSGRSSRTRPSPSRAEPRRSSRAEENRDARSAPPDEARAPERPRPTRLSVPEF